MPITKQVKVDNWGVFFLQRLKHFFNRTDYCDLTLQFQDFAQLKVHRLVLNACTEYFELLERTCEMYDECLVMPDDLQVDVVVPIVNFMYTGQLEYDVALFDRLYSTAQIMNMSVLTKLLDSQRGEAGPAPKQPKKEIILMNEHLSDKKIYSKVGGGGDDISQFGKKRAPAISRRQYGPGPGLKPEGPAQVSRQVISVGKKMNKPKFDSPRPTRYEVPEELENEDIFESSFADISYESRPLMKSKNSNVQKETGRSQQNIYDEASCSRKFEELQRGSSYKRPRSSSSDAAEGKHIDLDQINEFTYQQKLRSEYVAQEDQSDDEIFDNLNVEYEKEPSPRNTAKEDANILFGQLSNNSTNSKNKIPVSKDPQATLNHAKIISEVLKKYPHLVKNNKNIKLKIMSGTNKAHPSSKNSPRSFPMHQQKKMTDNSSIKMSREEDELKREWKYVNKNMNSEAMAKLVSLGASNTTGPWLCLMCGTPGKALSFASYHIYYHHLVGVHREKISANICEYCGYKSGKRNHLLHHLYTKHDVPPPSTHSFPKCNQCSYIALTEAFLIKHKLSHLDNREFSCNVCNAQFRTRSQMLFHIQVSGHKISPDRKASNQCVYCNKIFLRETNLYTHLKLAHKEIARKDGIIDNSDEEDVYDDELKYTDNSSNFSQEHVSIKKEYDGKFQIVRNRMGKSPRTSQKILNSQLLNKNAIEQVRKSYNMTSMRNLNRDDGTNVIQIMEQSSEAESMGTVATGIATSLGLVDRIVVLNDNEYILQSEQEDPLEQTLAHLDSDSQEMVFADLPENDLTEQTTVEISAPKQSSTSQINPGRNVKILSKGQPAKSYVNQNQPIQIVVSGNQQYKTLVSAAPLVYTTSSEAKATGTLSFQPHEETVQLQTTPEGTMMVLQDQDFNLAQTIPGDGSNIVVVYSHPLESDEKDYVVDDSQFTEVDQNQYENLSENLDAEAQIEHAEADHAEPEAILSDQGLVHETVETWQEEAPVQELEAEAETEADPEEGQEIEDVVADQEIPLVDDDKVTTTDDCNTEDILNENTEIITTETDEIIITAQEPLEHEVLDSTDTVEDEVPDADSEQVSSSIDQETVDIGPSNEACPIQQEDLQESVIIMETEEEAIEIVHDESIIENEISIETNVIDDELSQEPAEASTENVEKLVSEWSDDDTSPKKDAPQVVDGSFVITEEEPQETQLMEVEESIENIQKEVQKHMEEKDAESTTSTEVVLNEESDLPEEQNEDNGHDADASDSNSSAKPKSIEKICTILNDWEDDSQSEAMEIDDKKV